MPQELTTAMMEPLPAGSKLVRPYDKTTVYSTGSQPVTETGQKLPAFIAKGEAMEVHPLLAEKLIKLGKATKDKPAPEAAAPAPKSAAEVIASIQSAKSVDEVNALAKDDTRKTVQDAAAAQIATFK